MGSFCIFFSIANGLRFLEPYLLETLEAVALENFMTLSHHAFVSAAFALFLEAYAYHWSHRSYRLFNSSTQCISFTHLSFFSISFISSCCVFKLPFVSSQFVTRTSSPRCLNNMSSRFKLYVGPVLCSRGLTHCLYCQHPVSEFHFPPSFMLIQPTKQQKMAQVLGLLPLMWVSWVKF